MVVNINVIEIRWQTLYVLETSLIIEYFYKNIFIRTE